MTELLTREDRFRALLIELCPLCKAPKDAEGWPEVEAEHANCHGWYHCDPECCGGCPTCDFVDVEIEERMTEWEKVVTDR